MTLSPDVFQNGDTADQYAVIAVDERERITLFSHGAEHIFLYRSDEMLGKPLDLLLPHVEQMRDSSASLETASHMSHWCKIYGRRKDGREFPIEASISKCEENGRTMFTAILRDITERKQADEVVRETEAVVEDLKNHKQAEATLCENEERIRSLGQALIQSQARLRALATELNLIEERERKRLAGELHDYLAQWLVLCRLNLGQVRSADLPPNAEKKVRETEEVLNQALNYSRTLMVELSPPILQEQGLPAGLKWLAAQMQRHGLAVKVEAGDGACVSLPQGYEVLLFQSVRELLMNTLKHAGSQEVVVRLEQGAHRLRIEVCDEGIGFDPMVVAAADSTASALSSKFGLSSIRERMSALGGRLDVQSAPGQGTQAILTLPIGASAIVMSETRAISERDGRTSGQL
jgi:PAS domain S-box-containing protein